MTIYVCMYTFKNRNIDVVCLSINKWFFSLLINKGFQVYTVSDVKFYFLIKFKTFKKLDYLLLSIFSSLLYISVQYIIHTYK